MKLRLIALPWNDFKMPQPALGALAAYIAMRSPEIPVEVDYSYVDVAKVEPDLYMALSTSDTEGERVYATMLYPDRVPHLVDYWERLTERTDLGKYVHALRQRGGTVVKLIMDLRRRLDQHLTALVASYDWNDTIVGMTTSFSQLFANVLLAKRIRETGQSATIVLGGSTVSPSRIADSILETYPWIDYIIRGEGELPLHGLLAYFAGGKADPLPRGIVSHEVPSAKTGVWQVDDLDVLPTPDYTAYYKRVGPTRGRVSFPIEGSRGCWWDRTAKSTKSTCQFCNLNIQWDGFRQKSAHRIATEMRELSSTYKGTHFAFLDNIVRTRGYDEMIDAIAALEIDARIFHEARANMRPPEILRFAEVGLRQVQFGLEGLSTSFLKRINKGTTVIMNLEVMKTCAELGIVSRSNLITDFPGSTQAEVDETLRIIDRYAFAYEAPNIASFELGIDSVVARFPHEFGLTNLRNHDLYRDVMSEADFAKIQTFQFSFDRVEPGVDWWPVIRRVEQWKKDYQPHPLWYLDGQSFLHVFRTRPGKRMETFELADEHADLYRFCGQIRTRSEIETAFGGTYSAAQIDAALDALGERNIMYQEGAKFLALATAPDSFVASQRIRRQAAAQARKPVRRLAIAK